MKKQIIIALATLTALYRPFPKKNGIYVNALIML